jgi:hypothetical protein
MDDIENIKEEIKEFQEYVNAYKILDKCPKEKIIKLLKKQPEIFDVLEKHNYEHPDNIPQPRYKAPPVNIFVLDDLLGSDAFSKKSKSLLTYYLIKNRHFMVSFCMLIQNLKSVPKPIRSNCNLYMLGKFASKKVILNDLYEEISNILTEEQFDEVYSYATADKYGSLIIDNTSGEKKFYMGFDKQLIITEIIDKV